MPGPPPKNPRTRQRRNKVSTRAELQPQPEQPPAAAPVPDPTVEEFPLPPGSEWHPMTQLWWHDLWQSEMRSEFLRVDRHRLYMLAVLVNNFWQAPSADAHKEVRLAGQCFGLTPLDRRRLQWEMRTKEPEQQPVPVAPPADAPVRDPRKVLAMVKPA